MACITQAKDNKADGIYKKFDENGALTLQGSYKNDKRSGDWKSFFPSGKPKATYSYVDGMQEGEFKEYFENGKLSYTGWMVNDNKQGEHKGFNILGNITSNANYKNNDLDGYCEFYNCNGKKYEEQLYDEGWISFFSTRKLLHQKKCRLGVPEKSFHWSKKLSGTFDRRKDESICR